MTDGNCKKELVSLASDLSFITNADVESQQRLYDGQLHGQKSKPHSDTVPGSCTERHEHVGVYTLLILLSEPAQDSKTQKNDRAGNKTLMET